MYIHLLFVIIYTYSQSPWIQMVFHADSPVVDSKPGRASIQMLVMHSCFQIQSSWCHVRMQLVCKYSQLAVAYHTTNCLQIQLQCAAIAGLIMLCCWICFVIHLYRLGHACQGPSRSQRAWLQVASGGLLQTSSNLTHSADLHCQAYVQQR